MIDSTDLVNYYEYKDDEGEVIFERYIYCEPTDTLDMAWDNSEDKYNMQPGWNRDSVYGNNTCFLLYNLPKVIESVKRGDPILLVKSESDVEIIESYTDYTATCFTVIFTDSEKLENMAMKHIKDAKLYLVLNNSSIEDWLKYDIIQEAIELSKSTKVVEYNGREDTLTQSFQEPFCDDPYYEADIFIEAVKNAEELNAYLEKKEKRDKEWADYLEAKKSEQEEHLKK